MDALDGMDDLDAMSAQDQAQRAFATAQQSWRQALEAHRLAPPDAGFADRLAALSGAARDEAEACRVADSAGLEWPPHRAADSGPPYELRPGTGRRGPKSLWQGFDAAAGELSRSATGTDLLAVAHAYDLLAVAAAELSDAVTLEDEPEAPRRSRSNRSA
jgi:hypothetical protein